MRVLISLAVALLLASGAAYAQSIDNDQSLFENESTVDEPTDDQINIQLNNGSDDDTALGDAAIDDSGLGDSGAEDVETEDVTEETLCCQMSEAERAGNDLCTNVECP
jgi:hypothetical protein